MLKSRFPVASLLGRQRRTGRASGPYLIQPWLAIGDTIFALEVAERIWEHQPDATIDILCTEVQMQVLADHPSTAKTSFADLAPPSSHQSAMHIIPIPTNLYAEQSEQMQQKRHEYAEFLTKRHYATVFIENLHNFTTLFGRQLPSIHQSLRLFEIQAMVEHILPRSVSLLRDRPKYSRTRELVDRYFRTQSSQEHDKEKPVSLHLGSQRIAEAERRSAQVKKRAGRPDGVLLLVNADTSSPVTRPPTALLAAGITGALDRNPNLVVDILPGYTRPEAHEHLYNHLAAHYGRRIAVERAAQPEHLLDTTAFIDQADIFITGDTGLMHLAATKKIMAGNNVSGTHARNSTSIITLWGGTRPGYWGYPKLTTILGEGNPLQRQMYPGIRKYLWLQKQADYFGHIHPDQLTSAILTSASCFPGSETERHPISEP